MSSMSAASRSGGRRAHRKYRLWATGVTGHVAYTYVCLDCKQLIPEGDCPGPPQPAGDGGEKGERDG